MSQSVWGGLDKLKFYEDLDRVIQNYSKAPAPESRHRHSEWKARGNHDGTNRLSFGEERSWVSDLAFLAAVGDIGDTARAVSSFFVEEDPQERQLKFYGAANAGLVDRVQGMIRSILSDLTKCARKETSRVKCAEDILALAIALHTKRIHARLKSPRRKNPGTQHIPDPFIPKLVEKIKNIPITIWGVGNAAKLTHLQCVSQELWKSYNDFSCGKPVLAAEKDLRLITILKQAYATTTCLGRKTLETALEERNVLSKDSFLKHVRQLDKIARYWGACQKLSYLARANNSQFDHFTFEPVSPFPRSKISGTKRYVHAEIQLLIFVSIRSLRSRPRVFGVNKAGCYLCDCFIMKHGKYFTWGSHGTLLHMWKFPDANEIREKYGNIDDGAINEFNAVLRSMRADLTRLASTASKSDKSRPWAMQSRVFDSCETLPTFSNRSLTNSPFLENPQPGSKDHIIGSPTPQRRQDSGYESVVANVDSSLHTSSYESGPADGGPSAHPSQTNLKDADSNDQQNCTSAAPANEINDFRETPGPRSLSAAASTPPISSSSLTSDPSPIHLTNTTTASVSRVLSSNRTTTFTSKSLNLYLKIEPGATSTHESTARVRSLPDHQSILSLLSEGSSNPVLDRRGLFPGEICTIPVPETDSGRKLRLLLGKKHEGEGAVYLELENRHVDGDTT